MPFYLQPTGMTLRLPYILKWSCSELGLSLHPLQQTTLWLFLHKQPCCGNRAIDKEGWLIQCKFMPAVTAQKGNTALAYLSIILACLN